MLQVNGLTKWYYRNGAPRTLFENLTFDLAPGERLAVLGRNGQGKSTLIKILGGVILPSAGSLKWSKRCSWPLGFSGGVHGGMTGIDNIRFMARIYQQPFEGLVERINDFAELDDALTMPVRYYSSGMRARLAFGISLAIEFDCYLIDEVVAVGDSNFRQKCDEELFVKRKDRALVMASHEPRFLRHCTRAIIIDRGRAKLFSDMGLAADIYRAITEEHAVRESARESSPLPQGVSVLSSAGGLAV